MRQEHQVAIIGGGMVGETLAALLASRGIDTALIEAQATAAFAPDSEPDLRVSALNPLSTALLHSLGAWERVQAMRAEPFRRMQVFEGDQRPGLCFDAAEVDGEALGHIVENRIVQSALQSLQQPYLHRYCPARLRAMVTLPDRCELHLDTGQRLRVQLVIGADGAHSQVRQWAHIDTEFVHYAQQALVLNAVVDHDDATWQRFVPSGAQALLPLPGRRASLVWYHDASHCAHIQSLDRQAQCEHLMQAFPEELGKVEAVLASGHFPLSMHHARRYWAPRVALVGDAAHSVHPLAGQGVNLGLLDAQALADVLSAQGDCGDSASLRRYEQARRADNAMMLRALHSVYQTFSVDQPLWSGARAALLAMSHRAGPAKRWVMRHAAGERV